MVHLGPALAERPEVSVDLRCWVRLVSVQNTAEYRCQLFSWIFGAVTAFQQTLLQAHDNQVVPSAVRLQVRHFGFEGFYLLCEILHCSLMGSLFVLQGPNMLLSIAQSVHNGPSAFLNLLNTINNYL